MCEKTELKKPSNYWILLDKIGSDLIAVGSSFGLYGVEMMFIVDVVAYVLLGV